MRRFVLLLIACGACIARDVPARADTSGRTGADTPLERLTPAPRIVSWAQSLAPVEVVNGNTRDSALVRLYGSDGEVDTGAREAFERVACAGGPSHAFSVRVEQLVFLAAYHFRRATVVIVSGWREHAGRHGTGEAVDFKLRGVSAARLAAYLRGLPRAGVGVYTHRRTQFVHVDVRDQSYHWLDASPPGGHRHEAQLRDPHASQRDAAWTPEMDLPLSPP